MKYKNLIKTIFLFLFYLLYTLVFNQIFSFFNININTATMFLSDLIFFLVIIYFYREKIQNDLTHLKENQLKMIFIGVILLFLINLCLGMMTDIFFPSLSNFNDGNSSSVIQLFSASYLYSLFKTLLFAPIAEELLFKESIRDVVKNDIVFVITSSILYTTMNFFYSTIQFPYIWMDIIGYFLFSMVLSIIYLKSKDNIVMVMIIKFLYNLIPTFILIISMIAGVIWWIF